MVLEKEKIEFIKKNWKKFTNKELAKILNCHEKTVRNWKKRLLKYEVKKYKDFLRIKKEINQKLNLTEKELSYIAGFIDGEGSFCIAKCNHSTKWVSLTPLLSISNSNKEILLWIQKKIGKGTIVKDVRKGKNYKTRWQYSKQGFGLLPFLLKIIPYLRIKKKHAILLKKFITIRLNQKFKEPYSDKLWEIYEELKKLNKRGIK